MNAVKRCISSDLLKIIAMIPMIIGHFCSYLCADMTRAERPLICFILEQAALFAPPIFFFFVAEGFHYTRSRKQYALRLLLFALISQVPFCLVNYGTLLTWDFFGCLNIIFTLLLGLLMLMIWECRLPLPLRIVITAAIVALTFALTCEWMIFGVLIILGMHIFREKPKARFIWFLAAIIGMLSVGVIIGIRAPLWTLLQTALQLCFLILGYFTAARLYNGERGKHPRFAKWFFYIAYPLHLLLIFAAKSVIA